MAEALSIQVQARDAAKNKGTGSRAARKLRAAGRVPAVIYGHKQDPLPVSLARDDVLLMLKKQAHIAELKIDGQAAELAVVREAQWDYLGKEVIHLDFVRVSADEAVISDVPVELTGESPAIGQGGMIEQVLRHLKIKAKPTAIPRSLKVDIGSLNLGQSIHVREMKLPEGVAALDAELDQLVVHAIERKAVADAETTSDAKAEPKVEEKGKEKKEG